MSYELKISPSPPMLNALSNIMCTKGHVNKQENEFYSILYQFNFTKFKKVIRNSCFKLLVQKYTEFTEEGSFNQDERIALAMILKEC